MTEAEFFDNVYTQANGNEESVPWQHALSRKFIARWLGAYEPPEPTQAIVVAAGLGDDAAALARKGARVTAFDFSPTAVEWARSRHSDLDIDWHEANLFELPKTWEGAYDLVVEVFTVQSIQPPQQRNAAQAVRQLLGPGGTLVAVMLEHRGSGHPQGPPWPLDPTTVAHLTQDLLENERREETIDETTSIILVELTKPHS